MCYAAIAGDAGVLISGPKNNYLKFARGVLGCLFVGMNKEYFVF